MHLHAQPRRGYKSHMKQKLLPEEETRNGGSLIWWALSSSLLLFCFCVDWAISIVAGWNHAFTCMKPQLLLVKLVRWSMSASSEQSIDSSEELVTSDGKRRCLVANTFLVPYSCHFNREKAPQRRLCYSPLFWWKDKSFAHPWGHEVQYQALAHVGIYPKWSLSSCGSG